MCERLIKFSPVNMTQMWLLLPLFMFYLEVKDVRTEGKIGCFFNLLVCDKEELCYDDNAFGRCQAGYDEGGGIYRNILTPGTLRLLEQEMKRLFNGGYRWSDDYTQCVLQNILYTEKRHLIYDPGLCSRVLKLPLPTVPLEVTQQLEHVNPEDLAYISFNPSKENTYSEYADETYIPPNDQSRYKNVYAIDGSRDSTNQASRLNRNSYQIPKDTLSGDVEEDEEFKYQKLLEYLQKVLQDVASTLQEEEGENEVSPSQKFPLAEGSFFPDLERKLIYTEGGTEWIPAEDKQKSKNFKEESRKHLTSRLGKNYFNFETKFLDKKPTFVSHFNELGEGRRNDKVWWRPLLRENQNVNIFHRQDDGKSLHDEDHGWLENLKFLEKLSYNPEVREYIQVVSYADPEESRHLVDTYRSSFREDPVIEAFERAMRYDAKKPGQHYAVHEPEPPVIGYKNNMWEPIDMNTQRFNGQISYPSIDVATSERQAFPPFAE
ncbi:uncharacterized protein LOC106465591, partial [Limulus polyphemus]|uniref:Uncharacterized protein LOC106465591 n=1 Tax=Limulus polyphemus TaxID=6850 RepID=A0ABM1BG12_LIMPO